MYSLAVNFNSALFLKCTHSAQRFISFHKLNIFFAFPRVKHLCDGWQDRRAVERPEALGSPPNSTSGSVWQVGVTGGFSLTCHWRNTMKLLPVVTGLVIMSTCVYAGIMPEDLIDPTLEVTKELSPTEQPTIQTFSDKLHGFIQFAFMSLMILI